MNKNGLVVTFAVLGQRLFRKQGSAFPSTVFASPPGDRWAFAYHAIQRPDPCLTRIARHNNWQVNGASHSLCGKMDRMELRDKSHEELIVIAHDLATQLDLVIKEQGRRIASIRGNGNQALQDRERDAAQGAEENQGGRSPKNLSD